MTRVVLWVLVGVIVGCAAGCKGGMEPVPAELMCSELAEGTEGAGVFAIVESVVLPERSWVSRMLVSESGRYVAATVHRWLEDGRPSWVVCVWDMGTGERVVMTEATRWLVRPLLLSSDEQRIAVVRGSTVEIWGLESGSMGASFRRRDLPEGIEGSDRDELERRLWKEDDGDVLTRGANLELRAPARLRDTSSDWSLDLMWPRLRRGVAAAGSISADESRVSVSFNPQKYWFRWQGTDETPRHVRVWDVDDGELVAGVMAVDQSRDFWGANRAAPVLIGRGAYLVVVERFLLRLIDLGARVEIARAGPKLDERFDPATVARLGDDRFVVRAGDVLLVYEVRVP